MLLINIQNRKIISTRSPDINNAYQNCDIPYIPFGNKRIATIGGYAYIPEEVLPEGGFKAFKSAIMNNPSQITTWTGKHFISNLPSGGRQTSINIERNNGTRGLDWLIKKNTKPQNWFKNGDIWGNCDAVAGITNTYPTNVIFRDAGVVKIRDKIYKVYIDDTTFAKGSSIYLFLEIKFGTTDEAENSNNFMIFTKGIKYNGARLSNKEVIEYMNNIVHGNDMNIVELATKRAEFVSFNIKINDIYFVLPNNI